MWLRRRGGRAQTDLTESATTRSSAPRRDYLLWGLAVAFVILVVLAPERIGELPRLIDWPTIATLLGLMILAKAVEASGWLQRMAHMIALRHTSERRLALFLVAASALAAMVLTNDIALFILVPFTLALGRMSCLPLRRLIIFEALAVNTGSMLSPIGNPQNIFLWQYSGASFERFVAHMFVPFVIAAICLALLSCAAFSSRRLALSPSGGAMAVNKPLLVTAACLFAPFVVLANFHYTAIALALVAAVFLVAYPRLLRRIDWSLIAVFVLIFLDLGLIARYSPLDGLNLSDPTVLYLTGALLSQGLSNVPVAILLARHADDWGVIAWAVNVGALGTVIASLANLIALRLGRQRGGLLVFHAWSLPFFVVIGGLVWVWLIYGPG